MNEDSNGGVIADISESTEAGPLFKNSNGDIVEASNVDYFEEFAEQIMAKHLLSANIAAIKLTAEAQKSLIGIIV